MNKKIFNTGITILVVGIILLIIWSTLGTSLFYSFELYPLYSILPILCVLGILLFITGIVFIIVGAFMKEDTQYQIQQSKIIQPQNFQNQNLFCKNCGAKLAGDSLFCDKCGKKI